MGMNIIMVTKESSESLNRGMGWMQMRTAWPATATYQRTSGITARGNLSERVCLSSRDKQVTGSRMGKGTPGLPSNVD